MSEHKHMISIWTWVGLVLTVYGVIILLSGIYYAISPDALKGIPMLNASTAAINPNLWWGAIMSVAGGIFLMIGRKARLAA